MHEFQLEDVFMWLILQICQTFYGFIKNAHEKNSKHEKFESLMAMVVHKSVFCGVTPCGLVDVEELTAYTIKINLLSWRTWITDTSFIHFIGMCRMRWFLAVLRSFFHFSLLYTVSFHPFPPTSLPASLTSSYHSYLGLPLSLAVSKFIYKNFLGIQFPSIPCTCSNHRNLFNLTASIIVGCLLIPANLKFRKGGIQQEGDRSHHLKEN